MVLKMQMSIKRLMTSESLSSDFACLEYRQEFVLPICVDQTSLDLDETAE